MGRGRRQVVARRVVGDATVLVSPAYGADELHREVTVGERRYRVGRYGGWPVIFHAAEWNEKDQLWFDPLHRPSDESRSTREQRCYEAIRLAFADELDVAAWHRASKSSGTVHVAPETRAA